MIQYLTRNLHPVAGNGRNVLAPSQACTLEQSGPVPRSAQGLGFIQLSRRPGAGMGVWVGCRSRARHGSQPVVCPSDFATPSQSLVGFDI